MAYALNIHEFYNELKEAGFTEKQAEVIANIQSKTSQATIEQTKHDYRLDDVTTNQDLDIRAKDTDLKIELVRRDIKDLELKIMTQLSTMQQDIQMTKFTNRALLAICSVSAGALIKIAFFK
jgi:hypothetical protein